MLNSNADAANADFESRLQPWPEYRDKRAAGAVAEQRKADDHVREVMPLHDRQRTHQQQFVGNGARGYEQGRREQPAHGLVFAGQWHETYGAVLPRDDFAVGRFFKQ